VSEVRSSTKWRRCASFTSPPVHNIASSWKIELDNRAPQVTRTIEQLGNLALLNSAKYRDLLEILFLKEMFLLIKHC